MSNMFKINGVLTNLSNVENVIRANQNESFATDAQDSEILYYKNGAPVSSSELTFDDTNLVVGGRVEAKGGRLSIGLSPETSSRGIDIGATPNVANTAFLDFNSLDGGSNDYDVRLLSVSGTTGTNAKGTLSIEADTATIYCPIRTFPAGQVIPPAWYADYGITDANPGSNAITTIAFNTVFQAPPTFQITMFDKSGSGGGNQNAVTLYVTVRSTTGAQVQALGTMGSDIAYMWFAVGGVE